ncbi:hypothetical protein ACS0TY_021476 [Phlomoides rotata]
MEEEEGLVLRESTFARAERTCGNAPNPKILLTPHPVMLLIIEIQVGSPLPHKIPLSMNTTKSKELCQLKNGILSLSVLGIRFSLLSESIPGFKYVVILQLAMAEAMPLPHYNTTSIVIASGLVLNFLKYFHLLNDQIWRFWEEFITIAGISALPQVRICHLKKLLRFTWKSYELASLLCLLVLTQVMWSTFVPYIPHTVFPGLISFLTAVVAVLMVSMKINILAL